MSYYSYLDPVNSNLICCICQLPFVEPTTTRSCSHTFCYNCILLALGHASQCPVDRSPLHLDDLVPAHPIVRSLVDELIVECLHRERGCPHTCQRQLLAAHLGDTCQYAQVTCPEGACDQVVPRKDATRNCMHRMSKCDGCGANVRSFDLQSHCTECPKKPVVCSFCTSTFPSSDFPSHNASCPEFVIPCTHAPNGCPWTGPRSTLPSAHIPSCPYESIKGFFPVNNARLSTLTEENILLRYKVDALESVLQTMKREMQAVKTALGPWHRPEGALAPPSRSAAPEPPPNLRPTPHRFTIGPDNALQSFPTIADPDILAPYFPPEADRRAPDLRPMRPMSASFGDLAAPHPYAHALHPRAPLQHPVAPVNLGTTLEGSLASLRESIVSIAASLDSLARRNDIALTNETLRINEDVMSLRANIHGLRMQVHAMMLDRNAQVTGRVEPQVWNEPRSAESGWPSPLSRFLTAPQSPPSITKL